MTTAALLISQSETIAIKNVSDMERKEWLSSITFLGVH